MSKAIDIDRESAVPGISPKCYRKSKNDNTIIGTTCLREIYIEDLESDDNALIIDDSCYEIYDSYPFSITTGYLPISDNQLVRVATRIPIFILVVAIVLVISSSFIISKRVTPAEEMFFYLNYSQGCATSYGDSPNATEAIVGSDNN